MDDKPVILVADDRKDNLDLVRDLLVMEGYRVLTAVDGQEALERVQEQSPDLVILDLNMPRLNGYQVCERLKADPETSDIPVLMLTAYSGPDQRVKGLQLGAADYLAKPFDYRELLARVKRQLHTKQETDRLRAAQKTIRETFERFVSPQVVARLLADPSQVRLGGSQQTITVLFADLRGYTGLAEILEPTKLVGVLTGYLTVATEAVLAYEGTICRYAGDLIMAMFNAPLVQEDHALRAARVAFQIQQQMSRYHARLKPHLRLAFGIGIVTGEAVVGNIGAKDWLNYTAIGDTVNLAQRLEEMARGGEILVDERTCEALGPTAIVESKGLVSIRGRNEPVVAYALTGLTKEGTQ